MTLERIRELILDVPDFPKPGIVFKDITPLLADAEAFRSVIELMAEHTAAVHADGILAIESRGFIFGAALALRLGRPLHLVRKLGKLPRDTLSVEYELEYGSDHVEIHREAIVAGRRYLVVDDLIATGGTAAATVELLRRQQADVAACLFLIELSFLKGRELLAGCEVSSLVRY